MTKPRDPVLAGGGTRRPHELDHLASSRRSAKAHSTRRTVPPRGLTDRIVWRAIGDLKEFPGNPRRHPDSQSASEKRAVVIADNRLPERAVWDFDLLRRHFENLIEIDFDVELTGFSTGEVDLLMDGAPTSVAAEPADDLTGLALDGPAICRAGDVWEFGRHRLICGDARQGDSYERLLQGELAQMVVTDPPYNVPIDGYAMGRGKVRHREFEMASGEMSEAEFTNFLERFIR